MFEINEFRGKRKPENTMAKKGCYCGENKKRSGGGLGLEDDPNLNIQQQATDLSPTKKKKKPLASSPKEILCGKISRVHTSLEKHI